LYSLEIVGDRVVGLFGAVLFKISPHQMHFPDFILFHPLHVRLEVTARRFSEQLNQVQFRHTCHVQRAFVGVRARSSIQRI
jgi:hypothetical protein